jgi:hypothetical protein
MDPYLQEVSVPDSGNPSFEARFADLLRKVEAANRANEYSLVHNVILEIALVMLAKGEAIEEPRLLSEARKHFGEAGDLRAAAIRSAVEELCGRLTR